MRARVGDQLVAAQTYARPKRSPAAQIMLRQAARGARYRTAAINVKWRDRRGSNARPFGVTGRRSFEKLKNFKGA